MSAVSVYITPPTHTHTHTCSAAVCGRKGKSAVPAAIKVKEAIPSHLLPVDVSGASLCVECVHPTVMWRRSHPTCYRSMSGASPWCKVSSVESVCVPNLCDSNTTLCALRPGVIKRKLPALPPSHAYHHRAHIICVNRCGHPFQPPGREAGPPGGRPSGGHHQGAGAGAGQAAGRKVVGQPRVRRVSRGRRS